MSDVSVGVEDVDAAQRIESQIKIDGREPIGYVGQPIALPHVAGGGAGLSNGVTNEGVSERSGGVFADIHRVVDRLVLIGSRVGHGVGGREDHPRSPSASGAVVGGDGRGRTLGYHHQEEEASSQEDNFHCLLSGCECS